MPLPEIEERLRAVLEDKEVYSAVRVLFSGEPPGTIQEADRKAANLLLRTFKPEHLREFLTTGKVTFGEIELLASGDLRHKTEQRMSCIRVDGDGWIPRLDIVVAYYMHFIDDPTRIEEIVMRHKRLLGRGVHFDPEMRVPVEWAKVENAPYIFISGGAIAEVTGAPEYGMKALQAWCVLMRMGFEPRGEIFLIHGNGASELPSMWLSEAPRLAAFHISEVTGISIEDACRLIGWMGDPDATIVNPEYNALVERVAASIGEDAPHTASNGSGRCVCGECNQSGLSWRLKRLPEVMNGFKFRDVVRFYREHPDEPVPVPNIVISSGSFTGNVVVPNALNFNFAAVPNPAPFRQVIGNAVNGNPDTAA